MTDAPEQDEPPIQIIIIPVTPFQQNCSLVYDRYSKKGAVVDPGGDVERIRQAIADHGVTVEKIVLTHGHIDHVGGAADLAAALKVPIEGPHEADRPLMARVAEQGAAFGLAGAKSVAPNLWLQEGDTIDIAGRIFQVLHCPGHSPGHLVFYDKGLRFAFSGDVLFAGSIGRTDLPGGDHAMLLRSIRDKLLPLGDDVSFLPGHGPASTIGEERLNNPFLR